MTMASVVVLACLAVTGRRFRVSRHLVGDGIVMALAQIVLPSVLFASALQYLPAGAASLLYALVPAATAVWMRLLHTGSLGARATLGLVMSLTGAVFVVLTHAAGTSLPASVLGGALVAAAVGAASFAGVYGQRHASHPLLELMAPELVIGTLLLLAPGLLGEASDWGSVSLGTWAVICYLAVGVTVVPTALLLWLLKRTSVMRASLVNYLFPLVAVVLGMAWFGEPLTPELAIGGFMLLLGVAVVEASAGGRHTGGQVVRPCP
jgi:drug/metabolite transporter (DMT)-like permease